MSGNSNGAEQVGPSSNVIVHQSSVNISENLDVVQSNPSSEQSGTGVQHYVVTFDVWKARATVLGELVDFLEREEEDLGKSYSDILQSVYLQTCFFITLCSYMAIFIIKKLAFLWLVAFGVSVFFGYVVAVLLPIGLACQHLCAAKQTCQEFTQRRERLCALCSILVDDYDHIPMSDVNLERSSKESFESLSLLKAKFKGFKKEVPVLKFHTINRIIVMLIGLCCTIFTLLAVVHTVMALYDALYIAFYEARAPGPGVTPVSSFITRVALRSFYSNFSEQSQSAS